MEKINLCYITGSHLSKNNSLKRIIFPGSAKNAPPRLQLACKAIKTENNLPSFLFQATLLDNARMLYRINENIFKIIGTSIFLDQIDIE